MGTWICHLRVAEKLAASLPGFDLPSFYAGSIAPDSGFPNDTWTEFDPPKSVTHFLVKGEGEGRIRDMDFFRAYEHSLMGDYTAPDSSFLWGYYFHLLTDLLWVEYLDFTYLSTYTDMIQSLGKPMAIDIFKEDWYGLDHRFLRDNPDWEPWKIFCAVEADSLPVIHIPEKAIAAQFKMIRQYYTEFDPNRRLDRPFPYLNAVTMQRIVKDCAAASLKIFSILRSDYRLDSEPSALALLNPEEHAPYNPPLGDAA